jgi:hypothetical protein
MLLFMMNLCHKETKMTIPVISTLPPAPTRGDTEATFTSQANALVAALPTLVTEINAVGDAMETTLTAAQLAEANAETAETNAETAQAAAELAQQNAYASANFKGLWSSLVGALAKPASVAHNDLVWLLLNNLADVTASEPSTTNSDWLLAAAPPTSVTLTVTANSNGITAGNVVELVSTGAQNVQSIYYCEAPTISSLATLDGANNVDQIAACSKDSNSIFALWRQSDAVPLNLTTITTTGNSSAPTLLTTIVDSNTNGCAAGSIAQLSSTQVALSYRNATDSNLHIVIATDNGSNPHTFSTHATNSGINGNVTTATCALTSSNWLVAYADTNSDCQIIHAKSNATNAPTTGFALNVNESNNCAYLSLSRLTSTSAMLVFQNTSDSNGEVGLLTCATNDTTPTLTSSLAHLDGANNCTYITQSPIDSNHTLCAYNNATTSNGCLAVIQANGASAPTVISRAVFASTAVSYLTLSAHNSNDHSLIYTDSNSDGQHLVVHIDSNYNLLLSETNPINGSTNAAYNAVAALTSTTAIGTWQEGAGSDGKAATLTLTPTPVISGQLLGIAETSATNGASADVANGPIYQTTNTLTPGVKYYAQASGGIGTNESPIFVGGADTSNSIILSLQGNEAAQKGNAVEFSTAGSGTFTVPNGVTRIHATWSVTGSIVGSYKYQAVTANGPSERDIIVKPGQSISYTVATGGYVRFEWFYG